MLYWALRAPLAFCQAWLLTFGGLAPVLAVVGAVSVFLPHPQVSIVTHILGGFWVGPRWGLTVGFVSLIVAPIAALTLPVASRALDVGIARALLSHSETEALKASVDHLRSSREQAVDSAEAEGRRIERDLHDGAHQRLVALSMLLGRAQARLSTADDEILARLLREARTETTTAIGEIRDLTRGLHPPVLPTADSTRPCRPSRRACRCPSTSPWTSPDGRPSRSRRSSASLSRRR